MKERERKRDCCLRYAATSFCSIFKNLPANSIFGSSLQAPDLSRYASLRPGVLHRTCNNPIPASLFTLPYFLFSRYNRKRNLIKGGLTMLVHHLLSFGEPDRLAVFDQGRSYTYLDLRTLVRQCRNACMPRDPAADPCCHFFPENRPLHRCLSGPGFPGRHCRTHQQSAEPAGSGIHPPGF